MTEHGAEARNAEQHQADREFDLAGSGASALKVEDPARIGDIPLLGRLGSGGMGRVYLGLVGGEYAAVKQVHPHFAEDPMFLRRFGRELDNLARLPGDVTAPLLDSDRDARPPWCATAYVPGLTLGQALDLHRRPLPVPAVWLLLRHLAVGLCGVHDLGMVHRDLKPSNVMLTPEGATLIDFGIARAAEQSHLTGTVTVVGTPAYMSPEQAAASKDLTPATDVFALGSLLTYAATGRPPFGEGAGLEVLYRIVHSEPDLDELRSVDGALADVVASCLDNDPAARPTARELAELARERLAGLAGAMSAAGAQVAGGGRAGEAGVDAGRDERGAITAEGSAGSAGTPDPDSPGAGEPTVAVHADAAASAAHGPGPGKLAAAVPEAPAASAPSSPGAGELAAPHPAPDAQSPSGRELPGWPVAVMAALAERAGFVARARPTASQLGAGAASAVNATPPVTVAVPPARKPRRRRRVALLIAVPVVLAAGTPVLLQLLPDSAPDHAAAEGGPRTAASAPRTPGAPPAASTTAPGQSPARIPAVVAAPPSPAARGAGRADGTAAAADPSSSGTPTSPGTATAPAAPSAPGDDDNPHAYQSGSQGSCLRAAGLGKGVTLGSCGGDAAMWTMTAVPGGYHLVNKATAQCLQAGGFADSALQASCSASGLQTWYATAGDGLAEASDAKCLAVTGLGAVLTGIGTQECDGSPAQVWRRR
ncbi:protein kinase domain-containing protein [Actinacidiphila epipremni]|uniref:Protein kinase n=1 Tax=Actinacidiphila epipremni TaxID=2053013 RepID=A0ABX0ZGD6_9ACTN|nr:serine/threonine-protein kinase [Actinacidiphila epipremni]NJP42875.1 protein kinase [Actinacidiphila epipremni]